MYLQDARKIVQTNVNPAGIPEEIISHFPSAAALPTDNTSIIRLLGMKAIERHGGVTSLTRAKTWAVLEGHLDSIMDVKGTSIKHNTFILSLLHID